MPLQVNKFLAISAAVMTLRACVMGCKFALAIFIGRYLDLSSLGFYGLAAGAIAVVPVVVGLGMVHQLMRDAVTASASELTDGLRHYWSFIASVYGALLTFAALITIVFGASTLWILVIAVMLFEHFGNDTFQLFSNLQRPLAANAGAFLRGAAWVIVYIPLAIWDPNLRTLAHLFAFWLGGGVLSFLMFVCMSRSWPWRHTFSVPFQRSVLAGTVRKSLIIYVSDLGFIASQYVDRYLVTLFLGLEVAGIYFLFWTVANAQTTFLSMVVFQQQRPLLIKAYRVGGPKAHYDLTLSLMRTSILATATLSLVCGFAFQEFLPYLGQPSLAAHLGAFWLIMAGMAFRSLADFGAMGLFTAHRDRLTTLTNVVSVFILVCAQVALLPLASLYGAGGSILITFIGITLWRWKLLFGASVASSEPRQLGA